MFPLHKVKLIRLMRGLSQIDLAQSACVSVGRIHQIETGRIRPLACDLEKLATALKVKAYDLDGFYEADL